MVAPGPIANATERTRDLIASLSVSVPVVEISPLCWGSLGVQGDQLPNLRAPLELQIELLEDDVLVAVHSAVEPAVGRSRRKVMWICDNATWDPNRQGASLALRSTLIVAPRQLHEALGLPNSRYVALESADSSSLLERLTEATLPEDDPWFGEFLAAEIFRRHAHAESFFTQMSRSTNPRHVMALTRAQSWGEKRIESSLLTPVTSDRVDRILEAPALQLLADVLDARSIDDLEALAERVPASSPVRIALVNKMLRLGKTMHEWGIRLIDQIDDYTLARLLSSQTMDSLLSDESLTLRVVRVGERLGSRYVRLRSRLERLEQRRPQGETVSSEQYREIIDEIDSMATHRPLWQSGLDYWQKMTGTAWHRPESGPEVPPPPSPPSTLLPISKVDDQARQALAAGELDHAVELFESVRSLSVAATPPATTTEQAARLNLGWTLWSQGHEETTWRPYVESVLHEVAPEPAYVELRHRVAVLLTENEFEVLRSRLERLEQSRRQGEKVSSDQYREIVDVIDSKAAHRSLWETGLVYWHKMTGTAWHQPETQPEVPTPGPSATSDLSIVEVDNEARRALAAGNLEQAAKLFETVRTLSLTGQPPAKTTEQAARLNLGWTLWKNGHHETTWRPYIESVLHEVAPEPRYVQLRRRAAEVLKSR